MTRVDARVTVERILITSFRLVVADWPVNDTHRANVHPTRAMHAIHKSAPSAGMLRRTIVHVRVVSYRNGAFALRPLAFERDQLSLHFA